jgi:ParB/RepB/Spo0J family partition protein
MPPQIQSLPARLIRAGDNDRTVFKEAELRELADSLQKHGLIQPITVRPMGDWYEIVAGERRFRASQLLGWAHIDAIVRPLTDEQASAIMLSENIHRADIDPLDEAHAYKKRIDQFKWTPAQCAKAAKVGEKRVRARLLLLTLVPEAQTLLRSGQLGLQFGEALAELSTDFQRLGLRALAESPHPLLLREFRAVVARLLTEQAQSSIFDLTAFTLEAIEAHQAEHTEWRDRRLVADERLPVMKRVGTLGLSFETYLAQLQTSADPYHRQCAPIVGRIYQSLLLGGMCYPPRKERGSPLKRES